MFKTPDKKIIIMLLILAVIIVALAYFAFFWEVEKIGKMSEDYQKEKLNAFVVQEKKNGLSKLSKEIVDLKDSTEKLSAMFVKKDDALPLLKNLEDAAAASGCKITTQPVDISKIKFAAAASQKPKAGEDDTEALKQKNATSGDTAPQAPPDEMASLKNFPAFSVQVNGSFNSVEDYLGKMESLPYFVRPLIIDMAPIDATKQTTISAGTLATTPGTAPAQQNQSTVPSKNVTMTIVFVVYANSQ